MVARVCRTVSPFWIVILILIAAALCTVRPVFAAADSCVTDKCHSTMGQDKFVHTLVEARDCLFCHKREGKHKFTQISDPSAICTECHEKRDMKKTVHKPVKDGMCTKCHNPHQSAYKYQHRAEKADLCFLCHDKKMATGKFVHGPLSVGGCIVCHKPHQADFPKLLNAAGSAVCFQCHTDKAEAFAGSRSVHKPAKDNCVNCHSPHSGDFKYYFSAEGSIDLCFTCHADKKEWIDRVKVKHGGLSYERKCLTCHDPHVSNYVRQLAKEPVESCMMCHNKSIETPNGKIANMQEYLDLNKTSHGPIKQHDCLACHNLHGSDNFRILKKNFPRVFYASFDLKNYELCFNCHEKTIVLDPKTSTLTQFRNGEQNLHFVHVNKSVKGRTCRACHDAHATNNPKHIRDAVPFGAWDLPVGFQITESGGACLPGCHQKFGYDRKNPVNNKI